MDLDELDELDPVQEVDPSTEEREYGIVIYGATGYTGCLMVEHLDGLLSKTSKSVKWAIAGRDVGKLRRIARKCKTVPGIIVAGEPSEISQMARQARVVVSAAGPYSICGENVVRECVNQVTHYVDVTGEVPWIHDMMLRYHAKAKEKGAMIVHCAGAIAGPQELMSYTLVKKLGPLRQYREYFFQYGGSSGGTLNTNITTMERMTPETLAIMQDPFALGGQRDCGVRDEDNDCTATSQDPVFPSLWLAPAYNSGPGSRVVRRSCALFEETPLDGIQYGKDLTVTVRDAYAAQRAAEGAVMNQAPLPNAETAHYFASQMKSNVELGEDPRPGQGPPAATREIYSCEAFAVAEAESGEWAHVHYISGEAYEVTAQYSIAGALVLVEELDRVKPKERGGIITPAFAFHGTTWLDRVTQDGFAGAGRKITAEAKDGKPEGEVLLNAAKKKLKNSVSGMMQLKGGGMKGFTAAALTM